MERAGTAGNGLDAVWVYLGSELGLSCHGVLLVLAGIGVAGTGCRSIPTPSAVDTELAACIPADTEILGGIHLERLRNSATFQKLSAPWFALLEPLRDAKEVLVAYNGKELLVAARGQFPSAPAGAVLLNGTLALAGAPSAVRAATAQHATGRTGAPALLANVQRAWTGEVWAVVRGGVTLPLSGNLANLNRLARLTDYGSFRAHVNSGVELQATGLCPTEDAGRQLEETLRAIVSLASGTARDPEMAALYQSIQLKRDKSVVDVSVSASTAAVEKLLGQAGR